MLIYFVTLFIRQHVMPNLFRHPIT